MSPPSKPKKKPIHTNPIAPPTISMVLIVKKYQITLFWSYGITIQVFKEKFQNQKHNCLCYDYLSPIKDSTNTNHHTSLSSNTRDRDKDIFGSHTEYKS